MKDFRETMGVSAPVWIRCTDAENRTPIHVNMAFAATIVAHGNGSRIWIADEKRSVEVAETPTEIVEAMKVEERRRAPSEPIGPRPFAFPLVRPLTRGH
jgi:hypothetical protein